jgi:diadenosine tetraphosphate (Ap4A) HIT family hydrolase
MQLGKNTKLLLCAVVSSVPRAMSSTSASKSTFLFGPFTCKSSQVFYESPLSLCFVNLKPIVPGHVLVIPKRVCPRFADMTSEEVQDLWATVHHIGPVIEKHYGCDALNLAIQDGRSSGQSVEHVHVHVLPRKPNDFRRNDDVYEELENQKLDPDAERRPRTDAEMAEEATTLRALFPRSLL